MHPEKEHALENRVTSAAEAALAHHRYVSAIDVLTGMGLMAQVHVQDWRKGRIDFLERVIHTNLKTVSPAGGHYDRRICGTDRDSGPQAMTRQQD